MRVQISPREGAILRGKRHPLWKLRALSVVKCAKTAEPIDLPFGLWAVGSTNSIVFAEWRQCTLMGGHIGATRRIRLNRPYAAAMRAYVKLFWPLVRPIISRLHRSTTYVDVAYLVEEHMRVPWPFSLTQVLKAVLHNLKVLIKMSRGAPLKTLGKMS